MIARLLIGLLDLRKKEIEQILSLHLSGGGTNSHPDLLYFNSDSKLGIAEARKIKEHFSLKPYSGKGRAVVLEDASNLTDEAQNALLKTLEELPENGLFILGATSDAQLLPTVLSRCQVERLQGAPEGEVDSGQKKDYTGDIEYLLKSDIPIRFEYIEKLKDREEFFHELVNYFYQHLQDSTPQRRRLAWLNAEFLQELLQAEEWQNQNVAIRAILEYLMLVVPQKL